MKKLLLILSLSFFCFSILYANEDIDRWENHAQNTRIIRDQWGVPHVFGKTDADAVFGMIYAQCEDDFNRVEVNYITAMGRMAEVEGISALYTDLRMRLYIDEETIRKEYEQSPDWLKKLMDAFADGVNYYLHSHPEAKPKLLTRFEPWMALTFSEGSIGGDIETISVNGLREFYGNNFLSHIPLEERDFIENPSGSNGFAIAPSLSASGNALLLINPHTSFYFRPEVHMISEEGLNAYGAVTWGQFFIYQGFNEYNGWMHTSSRADAIDHFALNVEERGGKYYYQFGEKWRELEEKNIVLKYLENGSIAAKSFKVFYSHHGPVVRAEGDRWVSISLMVEREKALTQSFLRTKTKNHQEFKKTMDFKTNSSNNTVYADKDGNIAYYHGNFIPIRDPSFDWSGVVDGSNPATDWKGLHDVEEMIFLLNPKNGWIQNCNSTPFTAAGEFSPVRENYPSYMAPDQENARGLNAVRVLEDQNNFTLESLIQAAYDPYLIAFEELIPALVSSYNQMSGDHPSRKKLEKPIRILQNWDFRYGLHSVATTLAHFWGQQLIADAASLDRPSGQYIFDFLAHRTSPEMKLGALIQIIEKLEADFGTWEMPWGEVNRFQRITGDIIQPFDDNAPSLPVPFAPSQWGSLASYVGRSPVKTKKIYGTVGNSFVAVVEFGEKVKAKSILAGGQSGDPDSQNFYDQAPLYVKGEFKEVNYYQEDIEKNAGEIYHPGKR